MKDNFLIIGDTDNVAVALENIPAAKDGSNEEIPKYNKIALTDIKKGDSVIKYGRVIGTAKCDINKGSFVHSHNLASTLNDVKDFYYEPDDLYIPIPSDDITFNGYKRANGEVGVRNEIFVIPTVGCANGICKEIEAKCHEKFGERADIIRVFNHPFGCSQLDEDSENTAKVLAGLIKNPNVGAALVVSLGCENNNLNVFLPVLGEYDKDRVKFLVAQKSPDEVEDGVKIISDLLGICENDNREPCPVSSLKIGIKCGGSDAFSGITANAVVGKVSDIVTAYGGSVLMTEIPEMFGAEQILANKCINEDVFNKFHKVIFDFKDYYMKGCSTVSENPSPGNKEGGITTLEEKSLGCVQKGGTSPVVDVLPYGEKTTLKGLNVVSAPGNDIVAETALAAAGAQIILFTTGRGTPLGAAVPTVKISSNTDLYKFKNKWIDFDAGVLVTGEDSDVISEKLFRLVMKVAEGEKTKNEIHGYREISIWKNGVTL